ncbi:MAG TPA: hypothetical protein PLF81_23360 [Candidatus Anammoximicrobium sp.]|nr:hypothetical protein [Candidatus Anammoximicrobium sp.]
MRLLGIVVAILAAVLAAIPATAESLNRVHVVNDRAPDCSSLAAIVQSVTKDCKTDDERAIAIYNFCRYDHYHHAYPSEPGGISALKLINVYGWSLCGGEHTVMAALWEAAGYPWRYRGWSNPGHTTVEVSYGGRWHYLDTFLKFYAWMPDPQSPHGRTIAGQEDIRANPALVSDAFVTDSARKVCYQADNRFDFVGDKVNWTAPAFLVCGDTLEGVLSGVRSSRNAGSPRGWGGIQFDDPRYSTDVNLRPGFALTLDWNKIDGAFYFGGSRRAPEHTCGDKDYRNCPAIGPLLEPYAALGQKRSWSNGTLAFRPDLRSEAALTGFSQTDNVVWRDGKLQPQEPGRPAVAVVEMSSPYVITKASGILVGEGARAEISKDGKAWTPVEMRDFSAAAGGSYRYQVRMTFSQPVTALEINSVVQHNQEALPYLAPGRNKITITAANPQSLGDGRLVVTYAYCLGSRDLTPEQLFERDAEIARAHFGAWSDKPIVVQQTVSQLPATIEIPVPTPRGKQPVYPRMLFLRRELLAPGQQPLPVPAPPSVPKVQASEYLAEVANPWMIGPGKPATAEKRPTTAKVFPASRILYVSKGGEVFSHRFIKWLKDDSDAWILLVDFGIKPLPDPKTLASAKLIVCVVEAHDRAPMQAAAVQLDAPFETGQPFDFAKLGRIVGTTVVAQGTGPGAPFVPPRRYEIDVTRLVRAWASGQPQHGLALRIVPNRGVDDGWTVRFTPDQQKPLELEIATYADKGGG